MKTKKDIVVAGRFVISKSKTPKKGFFTEEVVYKTEVRKGKFASKTKHERIYR